jgi:ABC-type uncharacterized transport system substrate-binding protein
MRRFALHLFAILICCTPAAWAASITLVLSDSSGPYTEFSQALDNALEDRRWQITVRNKPADFNPATPTDLIVAAGSEALRQTLIRSNVNTPIIATLLPRQSYEKIMAEAGKGRPRVTAIYLDQPPARQAVFLRHLLPEHKRIGMLISGETRSTASLYQQTFNQAGLTLDSESSDTENSLLPAINALLPRINVLLANPDSTIYKRDNIKAILVTSYRHQRPIVAFSVAFVTAGALAAIYSTPSQIATQTAEVISGLGSNALPSSMAPRLFAVSINPNVAQAQGITTPDEASIRRAMLADQGPQ